MLETSAFLEDSGGGSPSELRDEGGSGGPAGDGDFNSVGRWPSEETSALLKIRSDMDLAFRDSSFNAPLWDEVSRKLGELGYNRSGEKCKEKFENTYKYQKRTRHGSSSTANDKSYSFSGQLEAFNSLVPTFATETCKATGPSYGFTLPCSSTSTASSSQELEGNIKKKRKLADYLERLTRDVLEKQDDLQRKLLEAIERFEKDRMAREEAWKAQEMARIKREQELLERERALAAAKDAAVLAFLQKIAQQPTTLHVPEILESSSEKQGHDIDILEKLGYLQPCGGSGNETSAKMMTFTQMGSARWPKAEVEALILLKTNLDMKYQDSGPKGPLWQEISSCMKKLGYERNAKRCKEKWENINKYYKRVKDGNKKRPEDSKTCPYFNMLDSIYAGRSGKVSGVDGLKPKHMLMQMMTQNQEVVRSQPSTIGEYGNRDPEEIQGEDGKECYDIGANKVTPVTSFG